MATTASNKAFRSTLISYTVQKWICTSQPLVDCIETIASFIYNCRQPSTGTGKKTTDNITVLEALVPSNVISVQNVYTVPRIQNLIYVKNTRLISMHSELQGNTKL